MSLDALRRFLSTVRTEALSSALVKYANYRRLNIYIISLFILRRVCSTVQMNLFKNVPRFFDDAWERNSHFCNPSWHFFTLKHFTEVFTSGQIGPPTNSKFIGLNTSHSPSLPTKWASSLVIDTAKGIRKSKTFSLRWLKSAPLPRWMFWPLYATYKVFFAFTASQLSWPL